MSHQSKLSLMSNPTPTLNHDTHYGVMSDTYLKKYRQNAISWNTPRKTRAVDSLGRIIETCNRSVSKHRKNSLRINTSHKCGKTKSRILQRCKRIQELSRPRLCIEKNVTEESKSFKVQKSALRCEASSRIKNLAKPKETKNRQKEPRTCKTTDISINLSTRIAKLAEPKIRESIAVNQLGRVNEKALFATATKRVNELAVPRIFRTENGIDKDKRSPFQVSRQALNAICSARMEELARPKVAGIYFNRCNSEVENLRLLLI
ncbi:uncharacterized protein LOC112494497 [Cephus cinctus]|uniref:Uncharacterized protein LOC112494497 n=1 Tax=Cephus cinctus TaxID=211228 RepID=A0AAJ7RJM6_CEPCN|nr:uncharacterized protein LOC112494497 [Cephus cinctus]